MSKASKSKQDEMRVEPQVKKRLAAALFLSTLMIGGLGAWGAFASLSGAVIAPGQVVVEGNDKKVQHPTGGVIGAILVKSGDRVKAGDTLLRLDPTQTKASLGIIVSQQIQLMGRKARLEAERDLVRAVTFPKDFRDSDPEAPSIASSEEKLLKARMDSKDGQRAQLNERIGQLHKEIDGLNSQLTAKTTEVSLMEDELERVGTLRKQNLVPVTRYLESQRDLTRLKGEQGALVSSIAKAEGQISEIGVQIIGLDQTMQTESMKELSDVDARLAELSERRTAAQDTLNRVDIKAPLSGTVHEMQVHTIGGVINPAETLMMIVPDNEKLGIEIKLSPTDIDQVTPGQPARVRFSAFNQRKTPEFEAEVMQVAAELTKEPQTGISYYTAHLKIAAAHEDEAKALKLVAGMPVEAFVETGERRAIAYLLKPFSDQIARAFKEE